MVAEIACALCSDFLLQPQQKISMLRDILAYFKPNFKSKSKYRQTIKYAYNFRQLQNVTLGQLDPWIHC
jgi:hypothetical protein